ncbi:MULTISPECIES: sensor histidine kinase [unclassified Streptomyces]|uniref:sensor histidine kinase n=1 Tax=unclassified Streptomyces TaxID=2593676 RepID=UPI000C27952B|nr:sensor histidine kinase [Streptomyces sp. CB02959]PJN41722.1 two-component sensor histidine kinase [Streptomyces sp. CB02959]
MIDRPKQWLRAWPWMAGPAVAVSCFTLSAPVALGTAYYRGISIAWCLGSLALACAPLVVRTRWPIPVVAVTLAVNVAQTFLFSFPGASLIPAGVAVHAAALRADRRSAWRVGACAAAVLVTATLISDPGLDSLWQHLALVAGMGLAAASGDATRSRRQLLASAVERAERAERTREEEAHRRVTEDRLRIARELHDVVAHHITLVNAQAGVAHHLMRTEPAHAYQALERIRDTSRTALDELRATVGLLRYGETPDAPREPAPGLADLDGLLNSFRQSGLDVTLKRTGRAGELPSITDLTAYRIIQEALTNTRKHAGAVTARVHLDHRTDGLRITVEDDGRGTPETSSGEGARPGPAGTGHGMIGMRERANAAGGTLTAGPTPTGGFRIHAELPLRADRKGFNP